MKKFISFLLVLSIISSSGFVVPVNAVSGMQNFKATNQYKSNHFTDVPESSWYADNVKTAYELSLVNGKGASFFSPNSNITIAETITLASRLNNIYNGNIHSFVSNGTWYQPYVNYAISKGIIKANEYSNFNAYATRAQFAQIFASALPDAALPEINKISANAIPDVPMQNTYSDAVYKLYRAGVLTGNDANGTFAPNTYIQRSAVAAIASRMAKPDMRKKFSLQARALTSREIFDTCSPAIVFIQLWDANNNLCGTGSGFFITSDGVAVTNYHVIEKAVSATASTSTNNVSYTVTGVLYYDEDLDYAVIKTNATNVPYLNIGDSSDVYSGDQIYAIGNPRGLTNTISDGIVANARRDDYNGMIQITAPISPGSSGGALLNPQGEVIGITTASLTSGQNLNFAVPINEVVTKSDLPGITAKYDMLTMKEFWNLNNGYSEPTVSAGTRQEQAFKVLKTFIIQNSNDTFGSDDYPAYTEYQENEDEYLEYSLAYEHQTNSIMVIETYVYQNDQYGLFMQLCPESNSNLCVFIHYAAGNNSNTATFIGDYTLHATSFTENSVINFEDAEGDLYNKTYYAEMAKLLNLTMLDFVDYIFSEYLETTGYSTVDFGFKAERMTSSAENGGSGSNSQTSNDPKNTTTSHRITASSFPLYLYAQDGTFLGNINSNKYDRYSITNKSGEYGSEFGINSIFNEFSIYGNDTSEYSAFNESATKPPKILDKNDRIVGYLTANEFLSGGISYEELMILLEKYNK